ncbi:hypothetical protein [Planobispora longispora]|uniref:Uncharacterized protein n=1 Tax=Planobispora longispora TaxID=28887 RepID=A0A8J3RWP4_9ACTN|nr:hypothetical protein [Planobispora longispora]GIH80904.1 hypothetical protein Plo01_73330 [Planobispora longispora]
MLKLTVSQLPNGRERVSLTLSLPLPRDRVLRDLWIIILVIATICMPVQTGIVILL